MINYLARVGWSYDDKTEIFDRGELIRYFDLSGINNSPARFSYDRLEWMNAYYLRHLEANDLARRLVPFLSRAGFEVTADDLRPMVPLIQERIKTLAEAVDWLDFFFQEDIQYDPELLVAKKMDAASSLDALTRTREVLASLDTFEVEAIESSLRVLADGLGLKVGQLLGSLRVAVTGKKVAPPLFETLAILGRARTLDRIDSGIDALAHAPRAQTD
jgi:glutamyl-tRNA synthetase